MGNYLAHMQGLGNSTAFIRRADYNEYNFGEYIAHVENKSSAVLEIGPGLGELLHVLNKHGIREIDILDNDKAVLAYCQKKYFIRKAIFSQGDSPHKYLKSKYDLIVLTQVFEHVPKSEYTTWIKGLYDALKPGGYILITVPNGANPLVGAERYGDLQHENLFTVFSFNELVTFSTLRGAKHQINGFEIPPISAINIIRIILQKILHGFFILLMIINGAIYQTLMTPNITLIIKKEK